MASAPVRDAFRAALAALASLPYVETLNAWPTFLEGPGAAPDAPPLWTTLSFPQGNTERRSIGAEPACWREDGVANIHVIGLAGKGDADVMAACEQVRDALWARQLTPEIRVDGIDPPFHREPDDGNWFEAIVPVVYRYDFFR